MIQINKPIESPECLTIEGAELTRLDREKFNLNPAVFLSGAESFTIKNTYKKTPVKTALRTAQHDKCAYCEKDLREEAAHVDHFRPKGAVSENNTKVYPGYYWLAYRWENLYLSCLACNSSYKKDFFPLVEPINRLRSHDGQLSDEEPMFINPGEENPRDHIGFRLDAPVHFSEKGKVTIEILKLDTRVKLIKARLEKLQILKLFRDVVELSMVNAQELDEFKQYLAEAVLPSSEFSSMAQDYLNDFVAP